MGPMSASRRARPKQAPEDETKRKFREALEAKQGRRRRGSHRFAARNPQPHGPVETKRVFRRKTG